MTFQEVSFCNSLLGSVPLVIDGHPMYAKTSTDVILLQVTYQQKMKEFDEFMQEVLKKLKKEGFDDRLQKHNRFTELDGRIKAHDEWKEGQTNADGKPVERPAKPSDAEIEEADKLRADEEDFAKEMSELDAAYQEAYTKKINEEVKGMKKFSRETYESIISFIGFQGNLTLSFPNREPFEVSRQEFLRMVGFNLVNVG